MTRAAILSLCLLLSGCQYLNPGIRIEPAQSNADRSNTEDIGKVEDKSTFKLNYYPKDVYKYHKPEVEKGDQDGE